MDFSPLIEDLLSFLNYHKGYISTPAEVGYVVYGQMSRVRKDDGKRVWKTDLRYNAPATGAAHAMGYLQEGATPVNAPGMGFAPLLEAQTLYQVHTHPYDDILIEVPLIKRIGHWPSLSDLVVLHNEQTSNSRLTEASWFWNPSSCVITPRKQMMLQFRLPARFAFVDTDILIQYIVDTSEPLAKKYLPAAGADWSEAHFTGLSHDGGGLSYIWPPLLGFPGRMQEVFDRLGIATRICSIDDFIASPEINFLQPEKNRL